MSYLSYGSRSTGLLALVLMLACVAGCGREERVITPPYGPVRSFVVPRDMPESTVEEEPGFVYMSYGGGEEAVAVTIELDGETISPMRQWLTQVNDPMLRDVEVKGRVWQSIGGDDPVAAMLDEERFAVFVMASPPLLWDVVASVEIQDYEATGIDGQRDETPDAHAKDQP
ncbi:MAG: hypothetical protein WD534_09850 [Phycisphaeraceae bacterium]